MYKIKEASSKNLYRNTQKMAEARMTKFLLLDSGHIVEAKFKNRYIRKIFYHGEWVSFMGARMIIPYIGDDGYITLEIDIFGNGDCEELT